VGVPRPVFFVRRRRWRARHVTVASRWTHLVVYSVTDRASFIFAQSCLQDLRPAKRHNVVILVANKQDIVRNRVISEEGQQQNRFLALGFRMQFCFILIFRFCFSLFGVPSCLCVFISATSLCALLVSPVCGLFFHHKTAEVQYKQTAIQAIRVYLK